MSSLRFANDGGPLIALDAHLANHWHGNRSEDYSEPIPSGSDYERACNARAPADLLQLAHGAAVIIGAQEGIATAWWQPLKVGGLCLVGCVYGDQTSDGELSNVLAESASGSWQHLGTMTGYSGQLLLLHAASEGTTVTIDPSAPRACIEDAVSASLDRGRYEVSCRVVSVSHGLYTLVQWQPIARAA